MPAFDPLTYRYASRRNVVYAQNAVACTFVLLGAQIGLDVMKSGGSAGDAAACNVGADSISARGTLWLRKHPRRGEGTPPYKLRYSRP